MAGDEFGGKVLGKPIQMVSADHQNKADVAADRAREWFDREGVDMIVDVPNSGAAIAVSKVANEKHRVFIVTGAGSTRLTNEDCKPYTIHYTYDTYATGRTTGQPVVRRGGPGWYLSTAPYTFPTPFQYHPTYTLQ